MQEIFRGQTAELRVLDEKYKQKVVIMTILYGRRRTGKTKLISLEDMYTKTKRTLPESVLFFTGLFSQPRYYWHEIINKKYHNAKSKTVLDSFKF